MVESNNILTVSYGTFSCTLEGFDDSFGTMKAIAEYFRDLAADDRYFGAEPPTPDVQMLAKIAEREITRRVEARTEDGGIVLRAETALAPAMPTAPNVQDPVELAAASVAPQVAPAGQETAAAPTEILAQPTVQDVTPNSSVLTFEDMAVEPTKSTPDSESVAAKLARIRAVVGKVEDENDNVEFVQNAMNSSVPEVADQTVTTAQKVEVQSAQPATVPDDEIYEDDAQADATDEKPLIEAETDITLPDVQADRSQEPSDDTLMAIDGVMPQSTQQGAETASESLDDGFEELGADGDDDENAMAAIMQQVGNNADGSEDEQSVEPEEVDEVDEVEEIILKDVSQPADGDGTNALLARLQGMAAAAMSAEMADEETPQDVAPANPARIIRVKSGGEVVVEPKSEADEEAQATAKQYSQGDEALSEQDLQNDDLKISESEDDTETNILAALSDAGDELDEYVGDYESSLSDADESDLQNELADLQNEYHAQNDAAFEADLYNEPQDTPEVLDEDDEQDTPEAVDEVDEQDTPEAVDEVDEQDEVNPDEEPQGKREPQSLPEANDTVMTTLMTEADEQLNEPEGNRRRNAIAQLKAAVAATEAARQLGEEKATPEEVESPFRLDLAEKKAEDKPARLGRPGRPGRPTGDTAQERPSRPDRSKIAPLKLVASQRIDGPDDVQEVAASTGPIAPRRVASTTDISPADVDSFAAFAKEMGASELPDLLEAAAAYTAFVEGEEDFSRPQIMKKVQLTTEEAISREDGLRHFGALLREGRISKVRGGRFQVAEDSRFNPDVKSA